MKQELERRVQYFFASRRRGRLDVRDAVDTLRSFGRLVIIGGMLRDLALFGNSGFCSDVDLVIDPMDQGKLEQWAIENRAKRNRFGGYRTEVGRWKVEVWPIAETWAHVAGHATVRTFADLRKTTFFRCDAIVYNFANGKLIPAKGYFQELETRVLEINLRASLNPKGNAVRAFRYALSKGFRWGPELTKFVSEVLEKEGWEGLVESERQGFRQTMLGKWRQGAFEAGLERYNQRGMGGEFEPAEFLLEEQFELPIGREQLRYR